MTHRRDAASWNTPIAGRWPTQLDPRFANHGAFHFSLCTEPPASRRKLHPVYGSPNSALFPVTWIVDRPRSLEFLRVEESRSRRNLGFSHSRFSSPRRIPQDASPGARLRVIDGVAAESSPDAISLLSFSLLPSTSHRLISSASFAWRTPQRSACYTQRRATDELRGFLFSFGITVRADDEHAAAG